MIQIKVSELRHLLIQVLTHEGLPEKDAQTVAEVYMRASYRGVGHHDFNDIFGRINHLRKGENNPRPTLTLKQAFGGLEVWDGDNGLGELCCHHATIRSMELAKVHGIAYVGIHNTNHFLAASPYTDLADEAGFFTIAMSKSHSGLSLRGSGVDIMGNNPFGYSAGHGKDPLTFDICCAYSSYGKMNAIAKTGGQVPDYWGFDAIGHPTTDAKTIVDSGLYTPLGEHKGFGLAIMIELLTAVLSGGDILNAPGYDGHYSQAVITIDVSKLMPLATYEDRVQTMNAIFRRLYPDVYLPGSRSNASKEAILSSGMISLDLSVHKKLIEYSLDN